MLLVDQLAFAEEKDTVIFCVQHDVLIIHHLDLIAIFSGHSLSRCSDEFCIFAWVPRSCQLSRLSLLLLEVVDEICCKLLSV